MLFAGKSRTTAPFCGAGAAWSLLGLLLLSLPTILTAPVEARLVKTLGRSLESRIARPLLPDGARLDGIIVLGGSPVRVQAALALAERFPGITVVLSGPGEAEVAIAEEKAGRGVHLAIDRRATTTYENALYSKDLVIPRAGQCWAVVTSAVHMPRAIGAFQAVGFPVLPWPVDDTPQTSEALSVWVWHEVLGLAGYWAFGRSSDLYPAQSAECVPRSAPAVELAVFSAHRFSDQ